MSDAPRPRLPWLLVVASVVLAALLAYTLFVGYLPAKQRIARLERELRDLYGREAELQTRLAQMEQGHGLRDRRLGALIAERDELARRLEELERQLAATRGRR